MFIPYLSILIPLIQCSYSVDWNVVMAGAVIAALPTALIYIFLGRFFVRGLLAGSVKG
jgi:glucose/mannose transport system permease protein